MLHAELSDFFFFVSKNIHLVSGEFYQFSFQLNN